MNHDLYFFDIVIKNYWSFFGVGLNGLFVVAEFAFVRVRPTRIAQLIDEGNRRSWLAAECIENIDVKTGLTRSTGLAQPDITSAISRRTVIPARLFIL